MVEKGLLVIQSHISQDKIPKFHIFCQLANIDDSGASELGRQGGHVPTHFLPDLYEKGTFAHPHYTTSRIIFGRAHPL